MRLWILGCRGVPAKHGGFETFAEQFSLYMAARGHDVTVACQVEANEPEGEDVWRGVRRVMFAEAAGPKGTVRFDLRSASLASKDRGAVVLTLGYNTAVFSVLHKLRGVRHFMNMDGVEWRRQKWSRMQRIWLRGNEWFGANVADGLIADHPRIKDHLSSLVRREKISVIPYGADSIAGVSPAPVEALGLSSHGYSILIARPEPENSVLEIVSAYAQTRQLHPLVILGKYLPKENSYHRSVLQAAEGHSIFFPGAIYDSEVVTALRYHARAYIHGHQVGGTNPSLVEALAAGNPVVAHRNEYNRWVAGESAQLFSSATELSDIFAELDTDDALLEKMGAASRVRHQSLFRTEMVMKAYEDLLSGAPRSARPWEE